MQVATHHVDPVSAVSLVGVRGVQAHHVRQVGQSGRLLLGANFGDAVGRLLAEGRGTVEMLHQVRQQAQDIQREAYGWGNRIDKEKKKQILV